jgi:hypothetical protein
VIAAVDNLLGNPTSLTDGVSLSHQANA